MECGPGKGQGQKENIETALKEKAASLAHRKMLLMEVVRKRDKKRRQKTGKIRRPGFDSRHYQKKRNGSGTGSTQPREYN
jgi:hypothetical protein